jgi:ATP-dependent DNA helicase RecQ
MLPIHAILKKYWGYDEFRPMQEDIIRAVLDNKDVLALLPTGGGKSICFQVPSLIKEGICIVISPLIALMRDQVENLRFKGIPALAIYSGMSYVEIKKTLQNAAFGNFKFLYVSPERLETNLFLEYLPAIRVNLVAVDEAHCISQWGYDFRPPYLRIQNLREHLPGVPVIALTASATKKVQEDICAKLLFNTHQQRFQQSFARPNLSYSVFNVPSKQNKLLEVIKNVAGSAIVYCNSRRHTKDIADFLLMNKISADHYHAGLTQQQRNEKQENWIKNKIRVIACTNAFGMGIDKPDVRTVIHFDVPDCLENYYQEAGRAGRDGKRAYAVLLFSGHEPEELLAQMEARFPPQAEIEKVYKSILNHLQVAAGTGEGVSYDFDIGFFANTFKLNILTVIYSIKALEQQELFSYNETFFQPSKIVFTCNRESLQEFEKMNPALDAVIKGLLRSYSGIFDFPCIIYEKPFAAFLKQDADVVKTQLLQLHQYGIIEYQPQKETAQLVLLKNRMGQDNFRLDMAAHMERKAAYEQRVNKIIRYLRDTKECRSRFIAGYFNDVALAACRVCDNCINSHTPSLSQEEFEIIAGKILSIKNIFKINVILEKLRTHKKEHIWEVINFLQAEKKLLFNNEGEIQVT